MKKWVKEIDLNPPSHSIGRIWDKQCSSNRQVVLTSLDEVSDSLSDNDEHENNKYDNDTIISSESQMYYRQGKYE